MDETEAQSQCLVTDWAGVGTGGFYAKSWDLARADETGGFKEGQIPGDLIWGEEWELSFRCPEFEQPWGFHG